MAVAKTTTKKAPKNNFADTTKAHFHEADGVWITPKGRGMFVFLEERFKSKDSDREDDKGAYCLTLCFPPEADLSLLYEVANDAAAEEGWELDFSEGENPVVITQKAKGGKSVKLKIKSPFLNAEDIHSDVTSHGEAVDLEGWITIRMNTYKGRPVIRDAKGNVIDEDDIGSECYTGRWFRAMVRPRAYTYENSRGVKFMIDAVQCLSHDDALGGGGPASDGSGFGAVDDEDEDDAPKAKKSAKGAGKSAKSKQRPTADDDEDEV